MSRFLNPSFAFSRVRRRLGPGAFGLLLVIAGAAGPRLPAAEPLRVSLIGADAGSGAFLAALEAALGGAPALRCTLAAAEPGAAGPPRLASLRTAEVAVFHRGPGALGAGDAAVLKDFLAAGRGCVVLGAAPAAWPTVPEFERDLLGATAGGRFASGAPMTVINLYPHAIFTGVARFETMAPMTTYGKLADDRQMIMEGTVGEETTPLAWLARRATGRFCHLVPAEAELAGDPAYQRIVGNAVLWAAGRPIPGAQPSVQRTFMPESYPGSFAITFPNGPGVCFDPVRGGINYVWDGDFVDLRPRWLTKQGEPPRIFGEVFYREKAWQPLRGGAPDGAAEFQFRGYALQDGGPEFHYLVNGREVHETLRANGDGSGIVRQFRVGPGPRPLWVNLEPQPGADVVLHGLERDGAAAVFPATSAGGFRIEIRRRAGGVAP